MLARCRRDQWSPDDLDWGQAPRALQPEDEARIVQLFTDMAGIERLAKALFEEQVRRARDPVLRAIFETFVLDEERHAVVAERLARHYDVRRLSRYEQTASLRSFGPYFRDAVRYLSDDIANVYITTGEVILDVALLRSINDFVHDGMSGQAMDLINRDEARHIAIDYYMVGYYASPDYAEDRRRRPRPSAAELGRGAWTFANLIWRARPFIQDVFFTPMALVDPSGARLREALKRVQALSAKPGVADRPFGRYLHFLQDSYHRPVVGKVFGGVLGRLSGVSPTYLARLNSEEELAASAGKSFEALAEEVLAIKYEAGPALRDRR